MVKTREYVSVKTLSNIILVYSLRVRHFLRGPFHLIVGFFKLVEFFQVWLTKKIPLKELLLH